MLFKLGCYNGIIVKTQFAATAVTAKVTAVKLTAIRMKVSALELVEAKKTALSSIRKSFPDIE